MSEQILIKAFKADEALTKFRAVTLNRNGTAKMAGQDDTVMGIALAGGNLSKNNFADILLIGICDATSGAAFNVGDRLMCDNQSRFIKATASKESCAIALEQSSAAEQTIRVLLRG